MSNTAQLRELNHATNRRYLALRSRKVQERRAFIFSPELDEQITHTRNDLVTIQEQLRKSRKEVNARSC